MPLAYNSIGVLFHNDWHGNLFENNQFKGNHTQVAVQGGIVRRIDQPDEKDEKDIQKSNIWQSNYWDDYRRSDKYLELNLSRFWKPREVFRYIIYLKNYMLVLIVMPTV